MVQWLGLLQTRSTTDWTDKLSYLKTKVQTFLIKLVFVKHKVCLSAQLNALFLVKVTICQQGALQSKKLWYNGNIPEIAVLKYVCGKDVIEIYSRAVGPS